MRHVEKAMNEIFRLCRPGETWRMTVPCDFDRDSDLILVAGMEALEAQVKVLTEELDDLRAQLSDRDVP